MQPAQAYLSDVFIQPKTPIPAPDPEFHIGAEMKNAVHEAFQFLGHVFTANLHAADYRTIKVVMLSAVCVFLARDLYLLPSTFYYQYFRPAFRCSLLFANETSSRVAATLEILISKIEQLIQTLYRRYHRKAGSNR